VVWNEVSSASNMYRWRDIVEQNRLPAFVTYNVGLFGAQVFGISMAHGIEDPMIAILCAYVLVSFHVCLSQCGALSSSSIPTIRESPILHRYAEVIQAVPCRTQLMHPFHLFPARLSFCSWRISDGVLKRDHVLPSLEMV
jgi:hypothetical protein